MAEATVEGEAVVVAEQGSGRDGRWCWIGGGRRLRAVQGSSEEVGLVVKRSK
jgi:hypothetical protein